MRVLASKLAIACFDLTNNPVFNFLTDVCKARNQCKNGATCSPNGDGYTCKCTANFQGQNCDKGIVLHEISGFNLDVILGFLRGIFPQLVTLRHLNKKKCNLFTKLRRGAQKLV